jgi:hypothetical protein
MVQAYNVSNRSVTVTTSGTPEQAVAEQPGRLYLFVQNKSTNTGSAWVSFTGDAAVKDSPSIELVPGASWQSGETVPRGPVSVDHATNASKVTVLTIP